MEMMLPRTAHQTPPGPLRTWAQKLQAHPLNQQEWTYPKPLRAPLPACLLTVSAHSCLPPLSPSPEYPISRGLRRVGMASVVWAVGTSHGELARMGIWDGTFLLLPQGGSLRALLHSFYPEGYCPVTASLLLTTRFCCMPVPGALNSLIHFSLFLPRLRSIGLHCIVLPLPPRSLCSLFRISWPAVSSEVTNIPLLCLLVVTFCFCSRSAPWPMLLPQH